MTVTIKYKISIPHPNNHKINVICTINNPDPYGQVISLPSWIPGSYKIRDLAKNLITITAYSNSIQIELVKIDKQTWRFATNAKTVTIDYTIFAFDDSPRGAYVDNNKVFFDSSHIFLQIHGKEKDRTAITIEKINSWKLATTLQPHNVNHSGFGTYISDDYWQLIDSPVLCGDLVTLDFSIDNVPHKFILLASPKFAYTKLINDTKNICNAIKKVFTNLPNIHQYNFYLQIANDYGGLEHYNSSSLQCKTDSLPYIDTTTKSSSYTNLLNLISHEYFHTWLVKSIKPALLANPDLSKEIYLQELWIYEGFTSYYDELCVLRAGCINIDEYLELLTNKLNKYLSFPGMNIQTLTQASFDAWTKFYQPNANSPNVEANYYLKGSIVACLLDIKLLHLNRTFGLTHILQLLWEKFGNNKQYVPEGFFEELIYQNTNTKIKDFLHDAIHTTQPLPLKETFALVGLELANTIADPLLTLGLVFNHDSLKISHVLANSPAENAGLAAHDELVTINDIRINHNSLLDILGRHKESIIVYFFRNNVLYNTKLTIPATSIYKISLQAKTQETKQTYLLRNIWLTGCNQKSI